LSLKNSHYLSSKKSLAQTVKNKLVAKTVYSNELPINFNWRTKKKIRALFSDFPITFLDCGARGKIPRELESLSSHIDVIAIDADENANILHDGYRSFTRIIRFLGEKKTSLKFHIYRRNGESSSLMPDPRYVRSFSPAMKIEKTVQVEAINLDKLLKDKIHEIDFLKIDVQGTESGILRGARKMLATCLFVEVEISFLRQYSKQDLWFEIGSIMDRAGFEPLILNRVFANRINSPKPSKGQMIFGDMIFIPKPEKIEILSPTKRMKLVLLLIHYGHADIALDYLNSFPTVFKNHERTIRLCYQNPKYLRNAIRLLISLVLDRIVLLYFAGRKTNGLDFDSDRSWPYR
jgi:FkbM family methyltransferase